MKAIEAYIESKQQEFMEHPFFEILQNLNTLDEISCFVPELTFWAMTFQDILRLNEERVQDPYLKKIARHHRLEDAGHEKWFLQDKKYMGSLGNSYCCKDDVAWLYGKESQVTRDAAYAILSEIYKIDDEILNIVLLLTLESSGHVFFEKVANQIKKTGEDENLKYFSSTHLEVEMAHAIFEEEMERKLHERKISVNTRREALKLVDRCYEAFNRMFDGLVIVCNSRLKAAQERKTKNAATHVEYRENQAV
ncbi:hypothetical protein [Legionella londiniensis]|uniref:PqqC-like protein n=1 Tax=Legionella londiniensis TaxID=45068 RepID=A0A0W0VMP1_9GAMM|nr:hypothetical protein [Legionella londiniensis]KTD21364.1 hypothetical protein Llon_1462 [Legionella londiniensis]STX93580.1 Uncharacterised protein [Legionella londiniensis]